MPTWADFAGTNEPSCASTTISAFWRRKVDLPAMFGPVTTRMRVPVSLFSAPSRQSLPTKLAPSPRAKFCSTMGWRPSTTAKTGLSSTFGRA